MLEKLLFIVIFVMCRLFQTVLGKISLRLLLQNVYIYIYMYINMYHLTTYVYIYIYTHIYINASNVYGVCVNANIIIHTNYNSMYHIFQLK